MREVESDNLDGSQTADTPPPPDGGGGLSGGARSGSNSSRQGRQPPASTRNPQTPPTEQIINHVTGWRNIIMYDFTHHTVRNLLGSRAQGEAIGLNEHHPLRTCLTAETAQFFCNILFTMAEDVQALWEASGETYRLLQPAIYPEDEASLTAMLNGWEKMALAILKRVFVTGENVKEDAYNCEIRRS